MAVGALPWTEIVKLLPTLVTAATRMWEQLKSQPRPPSVDPDGDPQEQLAVLRQRLEALESAEVAQAELVKQLIEQLQGLSAGLADISRRQTLLLLAASCALALSVAALAIALLR